MVMAPVPFTNDPGDMLHCKVQTRGEVRVDKLGGSSSLSSGKQMTLKVKAAVLGGDTAAIPWQQRAHTQPCKGMVHLHMVQGTGANQIW